MLKALGGLMFGVLLVSSIFMVQSATEPAPQPSETYTFSVKLSSKYFLYWKHNEENITFEIVVNTTGAAGLGFSTNGAMKGSDIVIAWHENETSNGVSDWHGSKEGNGHDIIHDERKDYKAISSRREGSWLLSKFTRKLDTCDPNDMVLSTGTTRVIWAIFNDRLPPNLRHHGREFRGTRSLNLYDNSKKKFTETDAISFEIKNPKITIPSETTTYWCQAFHIPKFNFPNKTHHIISYEPILTPGNEDMVHHILIYLCSDDVNQTFHNQGHNCYSENMPPDLKKCKTAIVGWAVGQTLVSLPQQTGIPIGGNEEPSFLIMETHYDNPKQLKGVQDSSGMKLFVTPTLRKYHTGTLAVGRMTNPSLFIPPRMHEFWATSHCANGCIDQGMAASNQSSMTVFATILHTHLSGSKIRTRLIRNGEEFADLGSDDLYDFNFQETRMLKEIVEVKEGDDILVECGYDSSGRDKVTTGGLPTSNEMCISFILYYPRIDLTYCTIRPDLTTVNTKDGFCLKDKKQQFIDIAKDWTHWTKKMGDLYQYYDLTADFSTYCGGLKKRYPMNDSAPIKFNYSRTTSACTGQEVNRFSPRPQSVITSADQAKTISDELCASPTTAPSSGGPELVGTPNANLSYAIIIGMAVVLINFMKE